MGMTEIYQDPHVKRSSSMTFALRWKHEKVRMISIAVIVTLALSFMYFMLLYGTAYKSVTVVLNGQEINMQTRQGYLKHLLDEQAIAYSENDRISVPLDALVMNGGRFNIETTSPISLTVDGETKTLYTTGKTVASVLADLKIQLGVDDKVVPALDSEVSFAQSIEVVRVKKEQEEVAVTLAFDTVQQKDATLLKGKEQTVQEGKDGTKLVQKEKVYENGKLVTETIVSELVKEESINKVVALGTKNPVVKLSAATPSVEEVSKNGVQFGYKQIINNVSLTAYSSGFKSTGKTVDDPQYGITFSGTTVAEGRTIAVDKNVIPIGWWVYIEGIGFRRAEDTGSGVKGNTIDVYFEKESHAEKFGRKHGFTVYVIGPKKPTSN